MYQGEELCFETNVPAEFYYYEIDHGIKFAWKVTCHEVLPEEDDKDKPNDNDEYESNNGDEKEEQQNSDDNDKNKIARTYCKLPNNFVITSNKNIASLDYLSFQDFDKSGLVYEIRNKKVTVYNPEHTNWWFDPILTTFQGTTNEELPFSVGGGNTTRYIDVPLNAYVHEFKFNITGIASPETGAAEFGDGSMGEVNFTTTTKTFGNMVEGVDYTNTSNTLYLMTNKEYNF